MQSIWKPFNSLPALIDAIDVTVPAPRPNIISTRAGLKKFLQRFREGPDCTTGMRHALNHAISSLSDSEPLSFEECIGRSGFGRDTSKPVLRLARQYFDGVAANIEECFSEPPDVEEDSEQNPPGHWKVVKAPSNRSACTRCKENIAAGELRFELGGASAIVANQGGRSITDYKHVNFFFDWLGGGRREKTKGLKVLEDITGYADLGPAEQERFQNLFQTARIKFQDRFSAASGRRRATTVASASSPVRARTLTAASPPASPSAFPGARSRPDRVPILLGSTKILLRMCAREQLGNDLRRAVRDLICDQNFDATAPPQHRLDFEILAQSSNGELKKMFLIERKSYNDLFASQRCEAGQAESRLDCQLRRLREASDYAGRVLISEAPDNDWRGDRMPDEYADLLGVKTKLQILQSEHSDLDQNGFPAIRVLRVRSPSETAQAVAQLMRDALNVGRAPAAASSVAPRRPSTVERSSGSAPRGVAASPVRRAAAAVEAPLASPSSAKRPRLESSPSHVEQIPERQVSTAPASTSISEAERRRRRELAAAQAEQRQTQHLTRGVQSPEGFQRSSPKPQAAQLPAASAPRWRRLAGNSTEETIDLD